MGKRVRNVVCVASGNCLEMFDFMVFGYYASHIARVFFPDRTAYASLMLTLMSFGAGFLMRPLGAIVLGAYVDRVGRRKGLLFTLALMAVGTFSIACNPGFATIGLLAPLLVVAGRLLQGLSAGVELGAVSVYLSEIATPGHRGFYVSWQSASQQVAVIFAALLGVGLTGWLSLEQMTSWGWRVPLLAGCLMIPMVALMRRALPETEAFLARPPLPPWGAILRSLAGHWRLVLTGMLLVAMTTTSFYLITAYTPTFGSTVLGLSGRDSLMVSLCVGLSNLLLLPLMGAVSDHVGRRPLLLGGAGLTLITAYPAMCWLVRQPSFARLLGVELWLSICYATYNGAMVVHLAEIVPVEARTAGFSLAYSLATALFGGFTPAICTYLIHATGNQAMPGLWVGFAAACGLTATLLTHEAEPGLEGGA